MRFLLITYLRQPGGEITEQVGFTKSLKPRDLQSVNVIIDYKTRKVNKCVIEGKVVPTTFESLNEYYKEVYPSLIEQLEKVQESESPATNLNESSDGQ
jgi:hypothetical protein